MSLHEAPADSHLTCARSGQISEIHVTGESEDMTAKERLLFWSRQMTDGYVGVRCDNFTTSWRDGRLFNAIIHKYRYRNTEIISVLTLKTYNARGGFRGPCSLPLSFPILVGVLCFSELPLCVSISGRIWLT